MAFKLPEKVQETTTSTGSPYTLLGAVTNYYALSREMSNGDTTILIISDGTDIEIGKYTYSNTSGQQITIAEVIHSSNGNAPVAWGTGTRNVFSGFSGKYIEKLIDPGMVDGFLCKTADRTYAARSIDVDTDDLQVANPQGIAGNPTLALAFSVSAAAKTVLDDTTTAAMRSSLGSSVHIFGARVQGTIVSTGLVRYAPIYPGGVVATSDALARFPSPVGGVARNFYVQAGASTADIGVPVTLVINGTPSTITATLVAGSTSVVSDVTHSETITAGDLLSLKIDGTGMTGAIAELTFALELG